MKKRTRTYRVVLTYENELPILKIKNRNTLVNIKFDIMMEDTQYIFDIECNIYKNKFTCILNNKESIGDIPDRFSFFVYSELVKNEYIIKLARSNELEYSDAIVCVDVDDENNSCEWLQHKEPIVRNNSDYVRIVPFTNKL